jgi:hypothetical protein
MNSITGEECAVSGIYRSSGGCGHAAQRPISKGERFPPCPQCYKAVVWTLVEPSGAQGTLDTGLSDVAKRASIEQAKGRKSIKAPKEALEESPQNPHSNSKSAPPSYGQEAAASTAKPPKSSATP